MSKELKAVEATEFKRTNGIVMRTASNVFANRFFKVYELEAALKTRNIEQEDIADSLDYLEGQGYVEVRHVETKTRVRFCDMELEEVEVKLTSEGKLVLLSIRLDDGIDM